MASSKKRLEALENRLGALERSMENLAKVINANVAKMGPIVVAFDHYTAAKIQMATAREKEPEVQGEDPAPVS